jgi:putative ABC transport system permease protein
MLPEKKSFGFRLLRKVFNSREFNEIIGDLNEAYEDMVEHSGVFKAKLWVAFQIVLTIPVILNQIIQWRGIMFKNYLKIAIRNFRKYKLFSFINVIGLAIGIAACAVISLWVLREMSYDRFHKKAQRIYRIERELFRDNLYSRWPITGGNYRDALVSDFPEIENAVRFWGKVISVKDYRDTIHRQEMFAVDNAIFDIFDFNLEIGDEQSALLEPMTVVLTRENAVKYFGTESALGKTLSLEWGQGKLADFKVTGILEKVPHNSHIHFDMLISISSYPESRFSNWRSNYLYTYVLVKPNTSKAFFEDKLKDFVDQRLKPHYGDLLIPGVTIHDVLKMHLFPITDIHLHPSVNWEVEAGGNITLVYIFSSVAILILIIACINFMNLSTARANKRAKEVSLRKTVGALKTQLREQFIFESLFLAVFALVISIFLVSLTIPLYNSIFNEKLSLTMLFEFKNILILLGMTLAVGIVAGLYPAVYLTRFDPVLVLKGGSQSPSGKSAFRRNMVVIQFIISITLIIGMFTVYKQMRFIHMQSLGFEKENVVIIPARSQQIGQSYETFRNELLRHPQIESMTVSNDVFGDAFFSNRSFYDRQKPHDHVNLIFLTCDYDFLTTYRMEVIAGRGFSRDFKSDAPGTIILNEAAAKRIGWTPEQAIGKKLDWGDPTKAVSVVGVVKNFHFKSLRREIEPVALLLFPEYIREISVRILPGNLKETVTFIQQKWKAIFPADSFQYSFLDSRISHLYDNERKMRDIFIVFSVFSVLVACLGLLGLSAFTAEVRTKEIGIRKTLGASTRSVTILLSREFIKWIIIANIAAWPLAWIVMTRWLENFAYKASIGWFIFFSSGSITLVIALLTFIFQAIKAARANPVDSLKYE